MRTNMILTIPDKNDKDSQIEYLKNALADVRKMLYEVEVNCIESRDLAKITDFIDKRLNDVTY